jgi:hypothetical protein
VITGRTLTWTSCGRYDGTKGYKNKKTDLKSGEAVFMSTTPIQIDESACPYTGATQSYPGLPPQCFTIEAFGLTFHETQRLQVAEGMNVTLESLGVQFRRDEEAGKVFTCTARWKISCGENAVHLTIPALPDLALASQDRQEATITSMLPGPARLLTTITTKAVVTGETTQGTAVTTARPGGTSSLLLHVPTDTIGEHRATAWTVLETEAGNIPLTNQSLSYNVTVNGSAQPQTATSDAPWWTALWDWIMSLFTFNDS